MDTYWANTPNFASLYSGLSLVVPLAQAVHQQKNTVTTILSQYMSVGFQVSAHKHLLKYPANSEDDKAKNLKNPILANGKIC